MAIVKPFRALRPVSEFAAKVASRPYDVLNTEEARKESAGNSFSFLHVTRAEIDLPDSVDPHAQEVYEKAKKNLQEMISKKVLLQESFPAFYIYELVMNGRSQTGLVAASSLDDYDNNIILKHEFTRPEKELDRINHMKTIGAQTGNVFMAYRTVKEIDDIVESWKQQHRALYDFRADDGISHTVWLIDDAATNEMISDLFASKVPVTYIADGHHRAASAAKVRNTHGSNGRQDSPVNYFLTTLFPSHQLQILDYNRVIKDLNGLSPEKLLEKLHEKFKVKEEGVTAVKPGKLHEFGMYLNGNWYLLTSNSGTWTEDPIGVLDITILQNNVLDPVLGIKDQRTDKRIDFIGGIRGLSELQKKVDSGEMAVAFSLYPVTIEQLFNIADSGNVMPPKSTWFEPKLRDGLLTHVIGDLKA
jgi:uncharacterized protein (DUF1015 family)